MSTIVESFNINGGAVPLRVIPIVSDDDNLYGAISYVVFATQLKAKDVRESIEQFKLQCEEAVSQDSMVDSESITKKPVHEPITETSTEDDEHVPNKRIKLGNDDDDNDDDNDADDNDDDDNDDDNDADDNDDDDNDDDDASIAITQVVDEKAAAVLMAATRIYNVKFEIYENGKLIDKYGGIKNPVKRLRVSRNEDKAHYDALAAYNNVDDIALRPITLNCETVFTAEQRAAYWQILDSVNSSNGGIFFLDGPAGTGKTFVLNALLEYMNAEEKYAIAMATTGPAATFLREGTTAHHILLQPLNLHREETRIDISESRLDKLHDRFGNCALIVWDECSVTNKKSFQDLNEVLRRIKGNNDLMGGVTVVLAGDFRKVSPITGGWLTIAEQCIKTSELWPNVKRLHLTNNFRVNDSKFFELLMNIGERYGWLSLISSLSTVTSSLDEFIKLVYPIPSIIEDPKKSLVWFCERIILTRNNAETNYINRLIFKWFSTIENNFRSKQGRNATDQEITEKVFEIGLPVMLTKNLNPPMLCNGTRLQILSYTKNNIKAKIMSDRYRGEIVKIPKQSGRMFEEMDTLCFLQDFSLDLCFAMTIHKSIGMSFKKTGVYLEKDCFTHGQLYTAFSRVKSASDLIIYSPRNITENWVEEKLLN